MTLLPDGRGVDAVAQLDAMMRDEGPEIDERRLAVDAADLLRGMFQAWSYSRSLFSLT